MEFWEINVTMYWWYLFLPLFLPGFDEIVTAEEKVFFTLVSMYVFFV